MGNASQTGRRPDPEEGTGRLAWWQLSLLGVGCTIGTGYFLGAGIGIRNAGPFMVLSFLLAAGTYAAYPVFFRLKKSLSPQRFNGLNTEVDAEADERSAGEH